MIQDIQGISPGTKPAVDPNDVCCEIYNPGGEEITFTNDHPRIALWRMWYFGKPPHHWGVIKCKPGEWVFLPHQYYVGTVPSGNQEIKVIKNYGAEKFKGNKLPSAPGVRRKFF